MRGKGLVKKLTAGLLAAIMMLSMAGVPEKTYAYAPGTEAVTESETLEETTTETTEGSTEDTTEDASQETTEETTEEGVNYQELPDAGILEPETEEETSEDIPNPEKDTETPDDETDIEQPQADGGSSFTTAQSIALNQRIYGSGTQYYEFTITERGYFTLNFQHDMVDHDYRYYGVKIYDSNQKEIYDFVVEGYSRNITTSRLGFPKGTYYIEVEEYMNNAPDYSLCVNFKQSSVYETEYNNTFTTANTIKTGKTYGGNLFFNCDKGEDEDYYKFTLTKAGYINLTFGHQMLEDDRIYYYITIYNNDQKEVQALASSGYEQTMSSDKIGLAAGTYFVKITKGVYLTNIPYTLRVDSTYSNVWETELNNTKSTADTIRWGTTYYGTIKEGPDEDYYTFNLTSKRNVELVFAHAKLAHEGSLWEVILMDSRDNEIWSDKVGGYDTKVSSGALNLPAGRYYIYVHVPKGEYSWGTRDYTTSPYNFRIQTPTIKVSKIKLNKSWVGLDKGKSVTLKATVSPSNANNKAVTWTSSNSRVATVSSSGKVIAKASGTATITCTAKDGSGKRATCKITVYNNTQAYVARIYTKALGRNAERDGLDYWTEEIQYGFRTPVEVAEEFFFAPEFTNKRLSNTEYVKVLYRTFMGREADRGGLNYWVGRLNRGESRKSVLEAFAGCPEFQKIVKSFGL